MIMKHNSAKTYIMVLFLLLSILGGTAVMTAEPAPPKLVLQITVDQLRGDLPGRYMKNMGEGGFRYLMEQGVWYANAHYGHSNTETVVGHTTLATGADPSEHGMVSNVWFDRETGKLAYNIEDDRYHILTAGGDVDEATEIDSTQKVASSDGRSPSNILVSTFSDELALHTNGKARIFGVSVKDRGAVTLAGHSGKAFWFSKASGEFITSSYYYDRNPDWVDAWNKKNKPRAFGGKSWKLLRDRSDYMFGSDDDMPWETDIAGFGRVFPHQYGSASGKYFSTFLTLSPAGDELTLDFAKALIDAEKIGQDEVTDFLAVSFSSTDYVGHVFGPSSLEAEDNMLRLDRTLANLFKYVDKHVGLKNTLIILSADHGGPDAPGYLQSLGADSGYVVPGEWDREPAITALKKRFGVGQELIQSFFQPYLYLNRELIREKGLDQAEVEQAVADELMSFKGVALAVSSTALLENRLPDTPLIRSALRSFHPKRSGDILLIFQPNYFINDFDGLTVTAVHGGPWSYDSFVPIVFAGGNLRMQRVYREVDPVDIAATLAAILGVKPPSGSCGVPLQEVMDTIHGDGR
jgi:predicted AlkP superfamily pyrophosphatase or phosphodiesterase